MHISRALAVPFAGSLFLTTSAVFAQAAPAAPAAPAAAPAAPAAAEATPAAPAPAASSDEPKFKPLALTLNPLSLILLRFGLNVEYLPAPHHGIMLNPYGQFISVDGGGGSKTSYSNYGAELGYHFYTGNKGANGFFIGPSLLFILANSEVTAAGQTASTSFSSYGAALDLGGQHVFDGGFTIGGGIGAMYLKSSATAGNTSSTVKFEGVLPRFLFTIGYSF